MAAIVFNPLSAATSAASSSGSTVLELQQPAVPRKVHHVDRTMMATLVLGAGGLPRGTWGTNARVHAHSELLPPDRPEKGLL